MGLVAAGAAVLIMYAGEKVRRARLERRRAKADYPLTGNDPTGRIIV